MKFKLLIFSVLLAISGVLMAQNETPADTIVKQDLAKNAEYFSKGISEKYNENYPVAIYNFEQALKYYNDDDASMYELSELYQLAGRSTEAFYMINQAANLQPDNKWYQKRLATFCAQNGDYQAFIKIYDKLIENEPNNLEYIEDYINVLLRIGDYDKVIEKLDVLEQNIGKNEYIFLQKAQIFGEQGKKEQALAEIEKLVEYMPENTQYLAMLAESYRKMNRNKDAYQLYLKIKELEPDNKYINVSLLDYYLSYGNMEKAFEEFLAAIKNPNLEYETKVQIYLLYFQRRDNNEIVVDEGKVGEAFIETHPDKPLGYTILGNKYYFSYDFTKAKGFYLKSLDYDSTSYVSLGQLAYCCAQLNDFKNTVYYTEKVIEYYPNQPQAYFLNALGYISLKDFEKALQSLEKGRKFTVQKEEMLDFDNAIAGIYYDMNNREKLYETFDRILRYDPDNILTLNNYAYYLSLDNKELDKALQMSGKTINAEPKNPTYLDTCAWVLYKLGRYDEAKSYMEKVFKYDKKPQGINYEHLGDILFKLGDTKNAVKNWKKAKKAGGEVSEFLEKKIKDEKLYE